MKKILYCVISIMLLNSVLTQHLNTSRVDEATKSVISETTQFALELLQTTSESVGKHLNLAISPFSIWAVLALIREGSAGKTKQQLQKALHIHESDKVIRATYRKLFQAIQASGKGVEMSSTSALFTDANRPLKWEFEYLTEKIYKSNIMPVDFSKPAASVNSINQWVSDVTHQRITQLVHEEDLKDPHLLVANGIFFKGKWTMPFKVQHTTIEQFYDDHGRVLGEVQMMHQISHFRYSLLSELKAQLVELPYEGGKFCMMVVVPMSNTTVDQVLERLSKMPLEKIYTRLATEDAEYPDAVIEVFLPKVSIQSDVILNKALEDLGVIDVFNDAKADLSGISPHNIHLNKLIHKTEIVINEEGSTAASATGGVMADRQTMPSVHANKPFAFFIVEKTLKVVMFAGKVVNPHM